MFCKNGETEGSGNERLVYKTARSLLAKGHDVRIYLQYVPLEDYSLGFVHRFPRIVLGKYFEYGLRYITGINDYWFPSTFFLRIKPWLAKADVWHFHNLHAHYLSLPILSKLSHTKKVIISPVDEYLSTGHCPYTMSCDGYKNGCNPCQRPDEPYPGMIRDRAKSMWHIKREVLKNSKFNVFFHTQALATHFHKESIAENPVIISYGEDINCYQPKSKSICAEKFGIKLKNKFTIGLFHGRITDPRKGIINIIKRLSAAAKQNSLQGELIVVGRNSNAVRKYANSNLSITTLPFMKNENELSDALNLCDVLLYPTKAENLSLTTLSALSCGVPVISYDVGGQNEAIKDDINGYLVPLDDVNKMIKYVKKMACDKKLCNRLSANARSAAVEKFDFEQYIINLEMYYREIVSS